MDETLDDLNVEATRKEVETEFPVVEGKVFSREGGDRNIVFRCEEVGDASVRFERLSNRLRGMGFISSIGEAEEGYVIRVGKKAPVEHAGATPKHLLLFSATVITTLLAGAIMFGINPLVNPLSIWKGWPFSASIMLVLGVHEMGHYLMSKRRGVIATPPYFIPVPPPFILGTLGAMIRMKSPMPDRDSLFDIGVAGPLLGLAAAVPVTLVGLYLSPIPVPEDAPAVVLGRPLIYRALTALVPAGGGGLHPVAFAGWIGFFVTFLNLLPVGQLDGGHVFRALLGERHKMVSRAVPILLLSMGYILTFSLGANGGIWIFWGFIAVFFHMSGHPPPLNDVKPLSLGRKVIGVLIVLLMIACFTPIPFSI